MARRPGAEASGDGANFAAALGLSLEALAQAATGGGVHDTPSLEALQDRGTDHDAASAPGSDVLAALLAGALAAPLLRPEHAEGQPGSAASGGAAAEAMPIAADRAGSARAKGVVALSSLIADELDAKGATARPGAADGSMAAASLANAAGLTGSLATFAAGSQVSPDESTGHGAPTFAVPRSPAELGPDAAAATPTAPVRGTALPEAAATALAEDAAAKPSPADLQVDSASATSAPVWSPAPAAHALPAGAAPGPAQAQVAPPVGSPEWVPAVAQQLVKLGPNREVELHLHPAELGPLQVKLSLIDNRAHIVFASEHAAVRQALEAGLPQLRAGFADSGIALGQATVGSGSGESPARHGAGQDASGRQPQRPPAQAAMPQALQPAASAAAARVLSPGPGRALDTFA